MIRRFAFAAAALLSAAAVFAAQDDVAILYNGNTPPNVDGLHFISQRFADTGTHRAVGVKDPKDLQAGKYKAIVVLSTGLASGIDKKLADFIASWGDKSQIILVSLRKGSKDLTVAQFPPSPDNLGVDAVTAASAWSGKGLGALFGGKNSPEYDMHVDWIGRVSALIDKIK